MRTAIVLGLSLLLTTPAAAEPPADPPAEHAETLPEPSAWFDVDYLLWWVSKAPLPVPLVTRGSPDDPFPGTLGQPGTEVLYGGQPQSFDSISGLRFGVGFWMDEFHDWGMEGNALFLFPRPRTFVARADATGNPVLAQPVVIPGLGERSYATSFPDQFTGSILADSTIRFYSWEINGMARVLRGPGCYFDALLGFRNLRLSEQLKIESDLTPLTFGALTFLGAPIAVNSRLITTDQFGTSTDVFAGQLGLRGGVGYGQFSAEFTGKIALGLANQSVRILGVTSVYPPPPSTAAARRAPGGILALPSNFPGTDVQGRYVYVPEVGVKVNFDVLENLRLSVGYNYLYLSEVVRPGDQVSRTISPRQVPSDPGFGTFLAPTVPLVEVKRSAFWANGLSVGLECRF